MKDAEQHADTTGYQSLRLNAYTGNPGALTLYVKLGYKKAGVVRLRKGVFNCYEKAVNRMTDQPD